MGVILTTYKSWDDPPSSSFWGLTYYVIYPKNPQGMSGLGCQVATSFEALKRGVINGGFWCFNRRGQDC